MRKVAPPRRPLPLALVAGLLSMGACENGGLDYAPGALGPPPAMVPIGAYGDPVLDRTLTGCAVPAFARVGDFETGFFAPRCGRGTVCHSNVLYPPNLKELGAYKRLLNIPVAYSMTKCDRTRDKYIDRGAGPDANFIVSKVRDRPPRCPSTGTMAGLPMPFDGMNPPNADEITCLLAYIKAIDQ